ncbi:MAG: hypothetical protein ACLT2T_05225 [Bilophila wadsworthia]
MRSSISWPHEGSACGTAALTGTSGTATGTNAAPDPSRPRKVPATLGNLIRRYGRGQRFRRFLTSPFRRGLGLSGKAGFGFRAPPLLEKPAWEPP